MNLTALLIPDATVVQVDHWRGMIPIRGKTALGLIKVKILSPDNPVHDSRPVCSTVFCPSLHAYTLPFSCAGRPGYVPHSPPDDSQGRVFGATPDAIWG